MSMLLRALPLTVAVVLVSACSGSSGGGSLGPEKSVTPEYVMLERVSDGSLSQLTVFAGCNDVPRLAHSETSAEVRVTMRLREYDSNGDAESVCASAVSVRLRTPLGGRRVIDAVSGEPVEVR